MYNAISSVNQISQCGSNFPDHPKAYEMIIDSGKNCLWFRTIRILNNKYSV